MTAESSRKKVSKFYCCKPNGHLICTEIIFSSTQHTGGDKNSPSFGDLAALFINNILQKLQNSGQHLVSIEL